jgi:hypothetical protein
LIKVLLDKNLQTKHYSAHPFFKTAASVSVVATAALVTLGVLFALAIFANPIGMIVAGAVLGVAVISLVSSKIIQSKAIEKSKDFFIEFLAGVQSKEELYEKLLTSSPEEFEEILTHAKYIENGKDLGLDAETLQFIAEARQFSFEVNDITATAFVNLKNRIIRSSFSVEEKAKLLGSIIYHLIPKEGKVYVHDEESVNRQKPIGELNEAEFVGIFRGLSHDILSPTEFNHYRFGESLLVDQDILTSHESTEEQTRASEKFKEKFLEKVRENHPDKSAEEQERLANALLILLDPPAQSLMMGEFSLFQIYRLSDEVEGKNDQFQLNVSTPAISMYIPLLSISSDRAVDENRYHVSCKVDFASQQVEWKFIRYAPIQYNAADERFNALDDRGILYERSLKFDYSEGFSQEQLKITDCKTKITPILVDDYVTLVDGLNDQEWKTDGTSFV